MSGAWQALQGGLSSIGSGISDGLSAAGNFASSLFGSGTQPMSGGADASSALLSQGAGANIPDVSGGASAAPTLSASSFGGSSGLGDLSDLSSLGAPQTFDMSATGGGSDALSRMLSGASTAPDASGTSVAAPTSGGGFDWGKLFSPKNIVPGIALANSVIQGNKVPKEIEAMTRMARNAAGEAAINGAGATQAMMGHLPGGAQASLDQALEAAKARIRSNYAALGMTGSSPEAQDLAYAELAASAQAFQVGQGMAQTGFNAAAGANNLASTLYRNILNSETARGTALGDALAEFAAGLVDPDRALTAHPHG